MTFDYLERLVKALPFASRLRGSRRLRHSAGYEQTLWTRKVADEETRRLVTRLEPPGLSALEISGRVWEGFGFRSYASAQYPAFDVCRDTLPGSFDLIIAEHIFEHVLWPYKAGRNVLQMLQPGGHFLIVTPFLYKVHPNPYDCTRWTETGMRYFLAECGFPLDAITTGSWGNRACLEATLRREYRLFNRHVHSLTNDPDLPMVVWALARK
jgi:SAM-dependent methyltransferase